MYYRFRAAACVSIENGGIYMVISIREVRLVPLSFPLVDTHEAFSDLQVAKEISIPT